MAASCAELNALKVAITPAINRPTIKEGPDTTAATPVTTKMPAPIIAPKPTPTASFKVSALTRFLVSLIFHFCNIKPQEKGFVQRVSCFCNIIVLSRKVLDLFKNQNRRGQKW